VAKQLTSLSQLINWQNTARLVSFSDAGWYDAVAGVCEHLSNRNQLSSQQVEGEIVRQLCQFVLYELKELITKQAEELNLEINF